MRHDEPINSGSDFKISIMRLLVSVRSVAEAALAVDEPVEIIDIKEPRRGSLGRADWSEIQAICQLLGDRKSLSVALGELSDWPLSNTPPIPLPPVDFAKLGLAGMGKRDGWQVHWQRVWSQVPAGVIPVAVAYVDHEESQAPRVEEVLEFAADFGCGVVLLDTYSKTGRSLLDHVSLTELKAWTRWVHDQELLMGLAGSVKREQVSELVSTAADILAVRGAVCRSGRETSIDPDLIRRLHQTLTDSEKRCQVPFSLV